MRHAPYLLSVLVLGATVATAHAAPSTIEGGWSGSGIANYRNLPSGDRRYEQSGTVTDVGGNRYTGWIQNAQFNQRGSVRMTQQGSRLAVSVSSRRGTANLLCRGADQLSRTRQAR